MEGKRSPFMQRQNFMTNERSPFMQRQSFMQEKRNPFMQRMAFMSGPRWGHRYGDQYTEPFTFIKAKAKAIVEEVTRCVEYIW